jgi:hypothetical protein
LAGGYVDITRGRAICTGVAKEAVPLLVDVEALPHWLDVQSYLLDGCVVVAQAGIVAFADGFPGAEQAHLDRRHGYAEYVRGLAIGEAVEVEQAGSASHRLREGANSSPHDPSPFFRFQEVHGTRCRGLDPVCKAGKVRVIE